MMILKEQLSEWLVKKISTILNINENVISVDERFSTLGLNSQKAVALTKELEELIGQKVLPTIFWDFPTINLLAKNITFKKSKNIENHSISNKEMYKQNSLADEPIAVVGISCKFPKAENIKEFKKLLKFKINGIIETPLSRWNNKDYYSSDINEKNKMTTKYGGYINEIDKFDADFFGITPLEALSIDPQQRLALELSYHAFEDAHIIPGGLKGSRVGIYVGAMWDDYRYLRFLKNSSINRYTATGEDLSIISARIAYYYGFEGPALTINTACSSSLVAVKLAVDSIKNGDCSMALVGGINLLLSPFGTVYMSKFGAMAPDGKCKTFDSKANGYVRGEGGGFVILKPLSKALEDGNKIYCLIKGGSINQDGFSNGLTAPNPNSQKKVLKEAYENANIPVENVDFIETHGTGTELGDPIEANAIGEIIGINRSSERPLFIGAVKTNIGHLESASGIAGLIKTCISLDEGEIYPNLNFDSPNTLIKFKDFNLKVPTEIESYPLKDSPKVAGVSSFGFGGTNCHIVLQEFLIPEPKLVHINGKNKDEIKHKLNKIKNDCVDEKLLKFDLLYATKLKNQIYSLNIYANSIKQLKAKVDNYLNGYFDFEQVRSLKKPSSQKVVFVFPGQGGQWLNMCQSLIYDCSIFKKHLKIIDQLFKEKYSISIFDEICTYNNPKFNSDTNLIQCTLFSIQVSISKYLIEIGLNPDAVIGHSMGEIAAANISGNIELETAIDIIYNRSKLLKSISGDGLMAVIELNAGKIEEISINNGLDITIACINSEKETIVAGTQNSVNNLLEIVGDKIFFRTIKVNVASHSPQVDSILFDFEKSVKDVNPKNSKIKFSSSTVGSIIKGSKLDGKYWVRNLRDTVKFKNAVEQLLNEGYNHFVEINSHSLLEEAILHTSSLNNKKIKYYPTLHRDEDDRLSIMQSIGQLVNYGFDLDINKINSLNININERFKNEIEKPCLLTISGKSPESLRNNLGAYLEKLEESSVENIKSLVSNAFHARMHYNFRSAIIGNNKEELKKAIRREINLKRNTLMDSNSINDKNVVFVFSGQGSLSMESVKFLIDSNEKFRKHFMSCDRLIKKYIKLSIYEELISGDKIKNTLINQPLIFAIQVSLYEHLKSFGIEPSAVIGHSVGEVAAAYVAKILSFEDAIKVVATRGICMHNPQNKGKMLSVFMGSNELMSLIKKLPFGEIDIAAKNTEGNTVISGKTESVLKFRDELEKKGIHSQFLEVDYAFHSNLLHQSALNVEKALQDICVSRAQIPIYSTVHGKLSSSYFDYGAKYWKDNITGTVEFDNAFKSIIGDGYSTFIEITHTPVLSPLIKTILRNVNTDVSYNTFYTLRKNENPESSILQLLGNLYKIGFNLNLNSLFLTRNKRINVPLYSFKKESYWIKEEAKLPNNTLIHEDSLIGIEIDTPLANNVFEKEYNPEENEFLKQHKLYNNTIISPAAVHIASFLTAIQKAKGDFNIYLDSLAFLRPLIVGETPIKVQVIVNEKQQISLWSNDQQNSWTEHAVGNFKIIDDQIPFFKNQFNKYLSETNKINNFYKHFHNSGYRVGNFYKWLEDIWLLDNNVIIARLDSRSDIGLQDFQIHPGLIDSIFQALIAAMPEGGIQKIEELKSIFIPFSIGSLTYNNSFYNQEEKLWCKAEFDWENSKNVNEYISGNILLWDEKGQIILDMKDVKLKKASQKILLNESENQNYLYSLNWEKLLEKTPKTPFISEDHKFLVVSDNEFISKQLEKVIANENYVFAYIDAFYRKIDDKNYSVNLQELRKEIKVFKDEILDRHQINNIIYYISSISNEQIGKSSWYIEQNHRCKNLLDLVHILESLNIKLWVTTENVIKSSHNNKIINIRDSVLWGMGKTIEKEYSELWGGLIDIDSYKDIGIISGIIDYNNEKEFAIKERNILVPRLNKIRIENHDDIINKHSTYVITGGTGGIGVKLIEWLIQKEVENILLVARNEPNDSLKHIIDNFNKDIIKIIFIKANIANPDCVDRIYESIKNNNLPKVGGIFHAAGTTSDFLIKDMSESSFFSPFDSKIRGAINIEKLSNKVKPQFLVLFSSFTSLLGNKGQINYTAANFFLDTFSNYMNEKKLKTISINWGPWENTGLTLNTNEIANTNFKSNGFGFLSESDAFNLMNIVIQSNFSSIGISKIDWDKYLKKNKWSGILEKLAVNDVNSHASTQFETHELLGMPEEKKKDAILGLIKETITKVSNINGYKLDDYNLGFTEMGVDSMMGIDIKNQLESILNLRLSSTLIFDHPNIDSLYVFLNDALFTSENKEENNNSAHLVIKEAEIISDSITEEEMERLIREELK